MEQYFIPNEFPDSEPPDRYPDDWEFRCQFCGKSSNWKLWGHDGDECPLCHKMYDYLLAQDSDD